MALKKLKPIELINDIYNVQPYGVRGVSLTLPAKYARRNGLERGSMVHMEELEDGRLIITPIKLTENT